MGIVSLGMRRMRAAALVVGGTAALATAVVEVPSSAHADAVAKPGTVTPAIENALNSFGTTAEAAVFGGMTGSPDASKVTVYLTSLDPSVESAFAALAPEDSIAFAQTPNSQATIMSAEQTLIDNWSALRADGLNINWFGPDVATGLLSIGVIMAESADRTSSSAIYSSAAIRASTVTMATATSTLSALLGQGMFTITSVTPASAASASLDYSRADDQSPFNAGDLMLESSGPAVCTSGYAVTIAGHSRILAAAHCFAPGTAVNNENGNSMGSLVANDMVYHEEDNTYSGYDTAYLSGAGDPYVFRGPPSSSTFSSVVGKVGSYQGDVVCQSGAISGEICNIEIQGSNICHSFPGDAGVTYDFCGLDQARLYSGGAAAGSGDSGAPVYRIISTGSLYATGTVTGGDGSIGHLWYTDIGTSQNAWSFSLNTA